MKQKRTRTDHYFIFEIIMGFILFVSLYIWLFSHIIYIQRASFKEAKSQILVSAGYDSSSDVTVWRENGQHYVNHRKSSNADVNRQIDNLIIKNEHYQLAKIGLISIGFIGLYLFIMTLLRVIESDKEADEYEFEEMEPLEPLYFLIENSGGYFFEDVRHKSVEIYDYSTDKRYPLDSEETESEEK